MLITMRLLNSTLGLNRSPTTTLKTNPFRERSRAEVMRRRRARL
jgi:hypothetical protein